ncbi:hypothetical protein B0I35DRAFT_473949 [Stachybotrys elegans]|uniref:BZIP domain-containing protein n=1 Tax=Stachybotrys elegans TaxID=80388 RepID=A0A8K0T8V7_9HYPO|nr:hypothetical protein B0I35DRAFT_473949 [Stachybotrys elegans]
MSSKEAQNKAAKRNSDIRKEQNRAASRNYRLKRKQKLALLDSLISAQQTPSNGVPASESSHVAPDTAGPGIVLPVPDDVADATLIRSITDHGWTEDLTSEGNGQNGSFDKTTFFMSQEPVRNLGPETLTVWDSLRSLKPQPSLLYDNSTSEFLPSSSSSSGRNTSATGTPGVEDPLLSVLGTVNHLTTEQKRDLLRHLQEQVGGSLQEDPKHAVVSTRESKEAWLSTRAIAENMTKSVSSRLQAEALRFTQFIQRQSSGQLSPAQLTRVFSVEVSFFAALFANCYALGMDDVEPMMVEEGVSPFSIGPETGYDQSLVPVLKTRFQTITPDLRPGDAQLTIGHHPYLDVIPFEGFRQKALKAIYSDPPLIDEEDLCHDFNNGALVCWGSQQNCLGMEAGVPWDKRSWEPKPWFLKKYWFLVGGWNDEMWMATRWWHTTRDEKLVDTP